MGFLYLIVYLKFLGLMVSLLKKLVILLRYWLVFLIILFLGLYKIIFSNFRFEVGIFVGLFFVFKVIVRLNFVLGLSILMSFILIMFVELLMFNWIILFLFGVNWFEELEIFIVLFIRFVLNKLIVVWLLIYELLFLIENLVLYM